MSPAAATTADPAALRVAIFDDVVAARSEQFHIPGLEVDVHAHADDAADLGTLRGYDVVLMDYAMGPGRKNGVTATAEMRRAGFRGRIVAISSDPAMNAAMRTAGADEALAAKAHVRSYLVSLGKDHLAGNPARAHLKRR